MLKFFSSIFKQKKIISFLLLFFVLIGAFLPNPNTAQAFSKWWCALIIPTGLGFVDCVAGGPVTSAVGDFLTNSGVEAATFIVRWLLYVPLALTALMSFLSKTLLIWVFEITSTLSFTRNQAVNTGWPIVRNLANIIIVVALIAIAMATILRFREYEAKKLLPKLILVALLVNFSLVACGLAIDASNITIKYLLNLDGGPETNVNQFYERGVFDVALDQITNPPKPKEYPTIIGTIIGAIFFQTISAIILFLYVFLFLFRIIALWILVILSPIAFACYAIPGKAQQIWSQWWSNFTQWCFIGVFGAFFFFIGEKMMKTMATADPVVRVSTIDTNPGGTLGTFSGFLAPLIIMLVPGIFLVIGFIFTLQTSAMGSKMAISGFKKAGGYLKAGALKAGGYAANKTGLTRAKEAVVDRATRAGERVGLVTKGTANLRAQARLEKDNAAKQTAAATPEQRQQIALEALSKLPLSETTKNRSIEAIKQMVKNKEIFDLPEAQQKALLGYVSKHEGKTDIFSQAGPSMVKFDTDAVKEKIRTEKMSSGRIMTEDEAVRTLTAKAYAKLDINGIREMAYSNNDSVIDMLASTTVKKLGKAREGLSSDKEAKLLRLLPNIYAAMLNARAEAVRLRGIGEVDHANKEDDRADALSQAHVEISTW